MGGTLAFWYIHELEAVHKQGEEGIVTQRAMEVDAVEGDGEGVREGSLCVERADEKGEQPVVRVLIVHTRKILWQPSSTCSGTSTSVAWRSSLPTCELSGRAGSGAG